MDIWQLTILGGALIILIYSVIRNATERRHQQDIIRKLYVYIYQVKDSLVHLSALQDHSQEVRKRFTWIEQTEFEHIEKSLLLKALSLSVLSYLKINQNFDFIRNNPFTNVALQNEDRRALSNIMNTAFGSNCKQYDIDLDDDEVAQIFNYLAEIAK